LASNKDQSFDRPEFEFSASAGQVSKDKKKFKTRNFDVFAGRDQKSFGSEG